MQTPRMSQEIETKLLNSNVISDSPSKSSSPLANRLWRPAAQKNVKNQWLKLLSCKDQWFSVASNGRTHASSLVNAYLSHKFLPEMDLGVLSEMPNIKCKASEKLSLNVVEYQGKLFSCYKGMVDIVSRMAVASSSMRCFLRGPVNSPLQQFGTSSEDSSDSGDGGGMTVFLSSPILFFENFGKELLQMFVSELGVKRLLVSELLSISCKDYVEGQSRKLSWFDELYAGEFGDLIKVGLFSEELNQPTDPQIDAQKYRNLMGGKMVCLPDRETLLVYLTAWLVDVNINLDRVDQIFSTVGEEMDVNLS